jgi:hypothetical protein
MRARMYAVATGKLIVLKTDNTSGWNGFKRFIRTWILSSVLIPPGRLSAESITFLLLRAKARLSFRTHSNASKVYFRWPCVKSQGDMSGGYAVKACVVSLLKRRWSLRSRFGCWAISETPCEMSENFQIWGLIRDFKS